MEFAFGGLPSTLMIPTVHYLSSYFVQIDSLLFVQNQDTSDFLEQDDQPLYLLVLAFGGLKYLNG